MLTLLKGLVAAIGNVFGFFLARLQLHNSKEMQESARHQSETDKVSGVEKAVQEKDAATVQKELAE